MINHDRERVAPPHPLAYARDLSPKGRGKGERANFTSPPWGEVGSDRRGGAMLRKDVSLSGEGAVLVMTETIVRDVGPRPSCIG